MSGWCIANVFTLNARERTFCMAAATLADLDGLSRLLGQEAYWDYHHVVCHNLPFAALVSIALAAFSVHRIKGFVIYLALAHLHLVLDYYGSGPGWPIHYGWPIAGWTWVNPNGWEFSSWQNRVVAAVFVLWVVTIAVVQGRTPVELLTPDLDRRIVARLRRLVGFPPRYEAGSSFGAQASA